MQQIGAHAAAHVRPALRQVAEQFRAAGAHLAGVSRAHKPPNPQTSGKCQQLQNSRVCVGIFYAIAATPVLLSSKNSRYLPFSAIGTRIATLTASTWFHAKNEGRRSGSLVQLLRPFLFSGPFGRSGRFDQPLELAA